MILAINGMNANVSIGCMYFIMLTAISKQNAMYEIKIPIHF